MTHEKGIAHDVGRDDEDVDAAIRRALAQAEELAIFPQVAGRIQGVIADPTSSIGDLEEAVSMDVTLGARLLRTANSPFYGLRREVGSLSQAIFVLGFNATRDLALALTVASIGTPQDLLHQRLWMRSLRCAAAAQLLTPHLNGLVDPSEAFVAGLTQDLGSLVMLRIERRRYQPLLEHHLTSPLDLPAAEFTEFGFSHAELSAACLRGWGLPSRICSMVRYHHTPAAAADAELKDRAEVLFAASLLADDYDLDVIPELLPSLGERLSEEALEVTHADLEERSQEWAKTLR